MPGLGDLNLTFIELTFVEPLQQKRVAVVHLNGFHCDIFIHVYNIFDHIHPLLPFSLFHWSSSSSQMVSSTFMYFS
jgi:hypothetical protein